jgi:hypothetical protein
MHFPSPFSSFGGTRSRQKISLPLILSLPDARVWVRSSIKGSRRGLSTRIFCARSR